MIKRSFGRAGAVAIASLAVSGIAHGQVMYKCVDEGGHVLYTDTLKPGCKALDLPSTGASGPVAAPPRRAATAATPRSSAAPAATPAEFPRVSTYQQKARDDDRREILNEELRSEEKKLAELRREFNNGEPERQGNEKNYAKYLERVAQLRDSVGRAEKNLDALKREIANIR
ncbi:DUF4124 domain-containing protein [Massilia eurypsychrophila]|uniref:DUF4124 domain-containing protein n=1 Tax=Massilia eurypsychrophila TaxID=1485217 RepID=A0A2G8THM0_9BURK|nr:DUF4124 domain-containing protein [Massilia eurypsychrophila]PIL45524.1 DUF4124 domain-containing protein [Massilia eurypsychrophila]